MVSACGQVHRAGWIGAARLTCRSPSTASVNSSGEAMAAVARDAARSAKAAPMLKPRLEEEMLSMATGYRRFDRIASNSRPALYVARSKATKYRGVDPLKRQVTMCLEVLIA